MKRYIKSDSGSDKPYSLRVKGVLSQRWGDSQLIGYFSTFDEALDAAKKYEKDRMWKIRNSTTKETKIGGHCKFKNMRFDLND